ncbi:MAG: hypothetical protein IJP29_03295 [Lachnospiraceae bacterium]|nr:hypothetical protein [Lachnospiraceae bacterium]
MRIQEKNILFTIAKLIICIFLLTIIECFALTMVATIPQKDIQQHTIESADILLENEVFFHINQQDYASQIDRYADSILLNIAWSYNENQPLESIMRSSYYYRETHNENDNLKVAVTTNEQPNKDYIRYWHGSNIIVRPLLLITNINGIYILNAIILFFLGITSFILLWKNVGKASAICLLIACITVSIWYVPFSLEYAWCMILMFIATILSFFLYRKSDTTLFCFFVILGNLTAYFDFLSTETITYTIPIIFVFLLKQKEFGSCTTAHYMKFSFQTGISWLGGYASAWIMKWTLASIVLQTNAVESGLAQANTRMVQGTDNLSFFSQSIGAIIRNLVCLFPFSFMKNNALLACFLTTIAIMIIYYLFKRDKHNTLSIILALIALLPYIRFFFVSNHSYLHYFFTYRAQLASIFGFGLAIIYGIDYSLLQKEWRKLWKLKKK